MQLALAHPTSADAAPTLAALYDAHADRLWRLLARLGVPDAQLEDALQEVFLIAHRKLASFRGDAQLSTWLSGITLRVAKDVRRSLGRRGASEPLDANGPWEAPATAPDELTAQRQALAQVLALLDRLDDPLREVFVLVEFDGLTAPEVSRLLGVNVNTVSTRLRTARLRFNALVESLGEGVRP